MHELALRPRNVLAQAITAALKKRLGPDHTDVHFCRDELHGLTSAHLRIVAQRCPRLQILTILTGRDFVCPDGLHDGLLAIAQNCPQLTQLTLPLTYELETKTLEALIKGCPNVSNVTCRLADDVDAAALAMTKAQIQKLCVRITDDALKLIAQSCPQLQCLDLGHCRDLTGRTLSSVAMHCPSLCRLVLTGCNLAAHAGLSAVIKQCPLQHLNLHACSGFVDLALQDVATHCPTLTHLDVSCCADMDPGFVLQGIAGCPQLTHLDLSNPGNAICVPPGMLGKGWPRLRVLDLRHNHRLTDSALEVILPSCANLAELDVTSCPQLTDRTLEVISASCTQLQDLWIGRRDRYSRNALNVLLTRRPLRLH